MTRKKAKKKGKKAAVAQVANNAKKTVDVRRGAAPLVKVDTVGRGGADRSHTEEINRVFESKDLRRKRSLPRKEHKPEEERKRHDSPLEPRAQSPNFQRDVS